VASNFSGARLTVLRRANTPTPTGPALGGVSCNADARLRLPLPLSLPLALAMLGGLSVWVTMGAVAVSMSVEDGEMNKVEVVVCVIDTRLERLKMNERANAQWLALKEAWDRKKDDGNEPRCSVLYAARTPLATRFSLSFCL